MFCWTPCSGEPPCWCSGPIIAFMWTPTVSPKIVLVFQSTLVWCPSKGSLDMENLLIDVGLSEEKTLDFFLFCIVAYIFDTFYKLRLKTIPQIHIYHRVYLFIFSTILELGCPIWCSQLSKVFNSYIADYKELKLKKLSTICILLYHMLSTKVENCISST